MIIVIGFFILCIFLLPFVAIGKGVQYAAQGGIPKVVRCPKCTQKQEAPANRPDYTCKACGAPILQGGEFMKAEV